MNCAIFIIWPCATKKTVGCTPVVRRRLANSKRPFVCSALIHGETIEKNVTPECEATFIRLQNELVNNLDRLFVFVEHPEVESTNNRSERNVRREAEIRKGGRTSKTPAGAKRRGVIMTVLASLQTRFAKFTLDVLLSEVEGWLAEGRSIFESELSDLKRANPPPPDEPAICLSG